MSHRRAHRRVRTRRTRIAARSVPPHLNVQKLMGLTITVVRKVLTLKEQLELDLDEDAADAADAAEAPL